MLNSQTLVSGNVSGTWLPANNPYVIIDNATVPSGQTLTVEPGTEVIIGSNLTFTVNGLITAKGTPADHIMFHGPSDAIPYNHIVLIFEQGSTNEFSYCDFRSAEEGLVSYISGHNLTMEVLIKNCTFSNCFQRAIYAEAHGTAPSNTRYNSIIMPLIRNCIFDSCGEGCAIVISGSCGYLCGGGRAFPRFVDNIFHDIHGAPAIDLHIGNSYYNPSAATIINNTFDNCQSGIVADSPYDGLIQDNIFSQSGYAVTRKGSLSGNVAYNCFFETERISLVTQDHTANCLHNRNGTSCDVAFNILQEPLFGSTDDFHLATNSPCIDAGTPDWAWTDMCFPPSQGTQFPDLGAYGGPDACNWLDEVPVLPTHPWTSQTNGLVSINWDALPRSTYEIQYITNITDTNWTALKDVTATEKPTSEALTLTNSEAYLRIWSLGRTPGN